MPKRSEYIQRQKDILEKRVRRAAGITEDIVVQLMTDTICIALHEEGLGETRVRRVIERAGVLYREYGSVLFDIPKTRKEILDSNVEEARENLDRQLRGLFRSGDFHDFYERYPDIPAPVYPSS